MHIRYPINLKSKDVSAALLKVTDLLDANRVSQVSKGAKFEDVFFVGPYSLVKDLYAQQGKFDKDSLRLLVDKNIENESKSLQKNVIANGIYLPSDYSGNLPFLMLYKRIDALGGKPVLISENYLTPGEFVVVPETSELFVVLFYNDGKADCEIPKEVQWYSWFSDKEFVQTKGDPSTEYRIDYDANCSDSVYRDGKLIELKTPLLNSDTFSERLLNKNEPVIQVYPVLSEKEFNELLMHLKSCKAWVRRVGENNILYTQETFDILEFSKDDSAPKIFRTLIEKFQSKKLVSMMTELSGIKLTALREVYAFHMQSNEFITKHADSTLGGQLLVRFNWLLQSPTDRKYDLRFWTGKKSEMPITRYRALRNSATIFYVGDETPHDLAPLPENSDKDRFNIVLSFGR